MNFVGYKYSRQAPDIEQDSASLNGVDALDENTPPVTASAYDETSVSDSSFGNL